jgi:hypothetical protein
MIEDILNRIRREKISGFSFGGYSRIAPERIFVHLASGQSFNFSADEVKFGRYEAYTLRAEQCTANTGTEWVEAGWVADEVQLVKRQDWLRPVDEDVEMIGQNPVLHEWGSIGSVPNDATHTMIVNSAVIIISHSERKRAMIYLPDYPGFVSFTMNPKDIATVLRAHGASA